MNTILRRLLYSALAFKFISGICRIFLPYDLPHRWRQIDTLSVSMRYWLRWATESNPIAPLLPAVLQSKGYGIMAMEFPLLNLLTAPLFFVGAQLGFILANALLYILNLALTFYCSRLWKDVKLFNINMQYVCLSFFLITLSSRYVFKFMPDYASFLLVFVGVSGAWNYEWKKRAFACAVLGLLMKPTSVVVFAFCFLHPQWFLFLRRNFVWIFVSIFVTVLYYTLGLSYIKSYQDEVSLFAVHLRNPLQSFLEFFSEPYEIYKLLFKKLIFLPGIFSVLFVFPFISKEWRGLLGKILCLIGLQIFAIVLLDGTHSFIHEYYYIGCAPLLGFLLYSLFHAVNESQHAWKNKILVLFLILCSIDFFDTIQFEMRALLPEFSSRYIQFKDCETLKQRHPEIPWGQNYQFRSRLDIPYPQAGICFFEREGSRTSAYGLYTFNDNIPEGCEALDTEGSAKIVRCL